MKHKVVVEVKENGGRNANVLRAGKVSIPSKIFKWLFGDSTQVFILKPGTTVTSVEIHNIKGETDESR